MNGANHRTELDSQPLWICPECQAKLAYATGGDPGPTSVSELADEITALGRYDGVGLRNGGDTVPAFRDDELRLSGRVRTTVRVVR